MTTTLRIAALSVLLTVVYAVAPVYADTIPSPLVPFQLIQNKIAVPALIDGYGPFTLAIDSGSETMSVSQKVADACKLTVSTGTVEVAGTAGSYIPAGQANVAKLQIGAAEVDKPFCTIDPHQHAVDGFVGAPLFNFYTVQIDFGNNTVTCFAPNAYKPDPNDIVIPITLGFHRVPLVHGWIGTVPVTLEIDTGSSFPSELNSSIVKANNLTQKYTHEGDVVSSSVAGPVTCGVYGVTDLELATAQSAPNASSSTVPAQGAAVIKLPAVVPTIFYPAGVANQGDWDGRLGEPVFAGMVITLDYAHSVMYIRPSQPAPAAASVSQQPPASPPSTASPQAPSTQPSQPAAAAPGN